MKPRLFVPAILSGLLLWTAFYPLDFWPMAYIAFVPFLALVRAGNTSRIRRYTAAYCAGLAFYIPALQWIRVAHPMMYLSWIGLSLYCALYWVFALAFLRMMDRILKIPFTFTLPVAWVALDYCRAHFPTGFPFMKTIGCYQLIGFGWYMPGYTQHSVSPLIQIADLGGVYALTVILCAFNGAVYAWLIRRPRLRNGLRWPADHRTGYYQEMWILAFAVLLVMGSVVYGVHQIQNTQIHGGPRVAAIQGNIPQTDKMSDEVGLFKTYDELCVRAAQRADLVIWPETCSPYTWYSATDRDEDIPLEFQEMIRGWSGFYALKAEHDWKTNVLVGMSCVEREQGRNWLYNSAVLFAPDGSEQGRYDKMHLVPFGEYVPFKNTFPWLQAFTPYKHDYSCRPGHRETRFPMTVGEQPYRFGVLICYEDSDPSIARHYIAPGSEDVDFLVNISNDGWFRGSEEHEQHLAICQFRAVETRRPIVRAVNMGISAIIDSKGTVTALPGDSLSESKSMTGIVSGHVNLDHRSTLYAAIGDWPAACAWAIIVLTALFGCIVSRRRPV